MRKYFWLGCLGLLLFVMGCKSPATRQAAPIAGPPQVSTTIPTPSAPFTVAPRTPTRESTPTPTLTETPASPTVAPQVCQSKQGQLSITYLNSLVLGRRVAYSLYLPPCYKADPSRLYPVLYLLHGAHTDHTQWPDLNVAPDADALISGGEIAPLVVVMPDGDYEPGQDYGAFVLRDLIPQIEPTWHIAPGRENRAIGGLSQGGYWALNLAMTHPDLFSAVGGHSPAADSALLPSPTPDISPDLKSLRIYLDVGNNDPLVSGTAAFAAGLRARGLSLMFHIYPGAHNRPYWRSHMAEYLIFYAAGWKK